MAKKTAQQSTFTFRNRYNARDRDKPKQDFGSSLTIEGETFTIQELFARSAARGDVSVAIPDSAFLDADIEQINQMHRSAFDLTDIADHGKHTEKLQEFVKDAHARALANLEQESSNSTKNKTDEQPTEK